MKLFKLIPLMALLFSVAVTSAFAEPGKTPSEDIAGKMCERMVASQIKKQQETRPVAAPAAAPVRNDIQSGATGAM